MPPPFPRGTGEVWSVALPSLGFAGGVKGIGHGGLVSPFLGCWAHAGNLGRGSPPQIANFAISQVFDPRPGSADGVSLCDVSPGGSFRKRTDVGVGRRPVCHVRSILSVGVAFGRSGNGDAGDVPQVPGRHPSGHGDPPGIFIGVPAMEDGCAVW